MLLSSLKSWSLAALTFRLAASHSTRKDPGPGSHGEFLPFTSFCSQASVPLHLHPGAPSQVLKRGWEGCESVPAAFSAKNTYLPPRSLKTIRWPSHMVSVLEGFTNIHVRSQVPVEPLPGCARCSPGSSVCTLVDPSLPCQGSSPLPVQSGNKGRNPMCAH